MSDTSRVSVGWDDVLEPLPAPRRLVTWRRALVALAAGVAALLAAAVVWVVAYAPLEPNPGLTSWQHGTLIPTVVRAVQPSGGKHVAYVDRRERGTVVIGMDVENTGRLPVRIEGLGGGSGTWPRDYLSGLWIGSIPSGSREGSYYGELLRFEPFTMEPGELRLIAVEVTVPLPCQSGSEDGFDRFPVRYSYLGLFHKESLLEMPMAVGLTCGDRPPPYPPPTKRATTAGPMTEGG